MDACLLAAVVVDEAEETTADAEEDEPVARWQFGADGGEAWSGRLVGVEGEKGGPTQVFEGGVAGRFRGGFHCGIWGRGGGGGGRGRFL